MLVAARNLGGSVQPLPVRHKIVARAARRKPRLKILDNFLGNLIRQIVEGVALPRHASSIEGRLRLGEPTCSGLACSPPCQQLFFRRNWRAHCGDDCGYHGALRRRLSLVEMRDRLA